MPKAPAMVFGPGWSRKQLRLPCLKRSRMKNSISLKSLIFMALCCDLGIIAKKLVSPAANIITDHLHIPGGIGTSFSLMFLVVAAFVVRKFGAGLLMGLVQSGIAFLLGSVGSMGALAPVGYAVPGLVIDICILIFRKTSLDDDTSIVIACALASVAASIMANIIVFRLPFKVLALYSLVACISGIICGLLAAKLFQLLKKAFNSEV